MMNPRPTVAMATTLDHRATARPIVRVSDQFHFRFIARGDKANALVGLAVKSLRRCHPHAEILVVDANDDPAVKAIHPDLIGDIALAHVPPEDDDVARVVGRGTRRHLFYWRHSPQLLGSLPTPPNFAVYSDADIIFLRPMDLASLVAPLSGGRIAAAVDESSIDYYGRLGALASGPASLLPAAGAGGPLLQAGLLFTNPANDGGFYDLFWQLSVDAAREGVIADLPFDDMCVVTAILGNGGPLWERLLPLGHEWNYITDAVKDPGVFGCAAHYGGHRAKAFVLDQREHMFPATSTDSIAWGSVSSLDATTTAAPIRGPWPQLAQVPGSTAAKGLPTPLPFSLSWLVPAGAVTFSIGASLLIGDVPDLHAMLFVYVDGRLVTRAPSVEGRTQMVVGCADAETVTVIAVSSSNGCEAHLLPAFERPTTT